MRVILTSLGSDGDHFPYIGLGIALRHRGHSVTLVAAAHYESLARSQDLDFESLLSEAEHDELFGHPNFWHPLKTAPLAARWGVKLIERQYALLSNLAANPGTVLVANPAVYAAKLVHEVHGNPLANLVPQPWLIPTVQAPPVMPHFDLARWPKPAVRLFWRALDGVGHVLVGRHLNRLRKRLGLPPGRRMFRSWFSPQLVLGLFPAWYGAPQDDWPPAVQLVGFPRFDGGRMRELPESVQEFCRSSPPPITFTFGTEMRHSADLFRISAAACATLGRRGILLTKYRDQVPTNLPPGIIHCDFAPFQKLFPLCAVVVHHGGIGTTAQGLFAGVPQVFLPISFDQMDNAARVQRLGAGERVSANVARPELLVAALRRALEPEVRVRCQIIRDRLAREADPFPAAVGSIEKMDEAKGDAKAVVQE
ncbi:MAG TPA: glycosyltransferase [Verrucomicrobiota bacterium]|nr:glycosyltransferase [Verrucomicrobiota bacterium]